MKLLNVVREPRTVYNKGVKARLTRSCWAMAKSENRSLCVADEADMKRWRLSERLCTYAKSYLR